MLRQWACDQFSSVKQITCYFHCHTICAPSNFSELATLCWPQLPVKVSCAQPTANSINACLRSIPPLRKIATDLFTACRQQTWLTCLVRLFPPFGRGAHGRSALQASPASLGVCARRWHAVPRAIGCRFKRVSRTFRQNPCIFRLMVLE